MARGEHGEIPRRCRTGEQGAAGADAESVQRRGRASTRAARTVLARALPAGGQPGCPAGRERPLAVRPALIPAPGFPDQKATKAAFRKRQCLKSFVWDLFARVI